MCSVFVEYQSLCQFLYNIITKNPSVSSGAQLDYIVLYENVWASSVTHCVSFSISSLVTITITITKFYMLFLTRNFLFAYCFKILFIIVFPFKFVFDLLNKLLFVLISSIYYLVVGVCLWIQELCVLFCLD